MTRTSEQLLSMVVKTLEDKKAHDLVSLNIKEVSLLADYFVICHGNSATQVQALASEIKKKAAENGVDLRGFEGYDSAKWVLIDLGDVVVHIFHRDEREYYNLERLWSDAKVVELA